MYETILLIFTPNRYDSMSKELVKDLYDSLASAGDSAMCNESLLEGYEIYAHGWMGKGRDNYSQFRNISI